MKEKNKIKIISLIGASLIPLSSISLTKDNNEKKIISKYNYQNKESYSIKEIGNYRKQEFYTIDDLSNLDYVLLNVYSNSDISWLKYCKKINELILCINCSFSDWQIILKDLNSINFEEFKNLDKLIITGMYDESLVFDSNNFGFLNNLNNVKELDLTLAHLDSSFIENFNMVEKLKLAIKDYNLNIDYKKFKNLKRIEFTNSKGEYDTAIYLKNSDIDVLENNQVSIGFNGKLDKLKKINTILDCYVNSLNINVCDSKIERLNKLSIFILDLLEYDNKMKNDIINNSKESSYISSFYKDGNLYGALENNGEAICGNYSALAVALANRIGLNMLDISSRGHAWNLVELDNKFYYNDLTFLDSNKNSKNYIKYCMSNNLDYYLFSINNKYDVDHISKSLPYYAKNNTLGSNFPILFHLLVKSLEIYFLIELKKKYKNKKYIHK